MQYTPLGNSELTVSRICLGCMGFGDPAQGQHSWTLDYPESYDIIRRAFELGINFYDTAIAYQNGTSEQYLGRALHKLCKRDDAIIATKFLPRSLEQATQLSTKTHIQNMVTASLKNLDTDYLDLYIMHTWDSISDLHEVMEALNETVTSGKVRALGIANSFAWQVAEANAVAAREGFAQFVSVQNHYNLIYREDERELFAYATLKNLALTPYSALASGRLARLSGSSKRLEEDAYAKFKYDATAKLDQIIINRVAELAEKHSVTMTQIALAWLLTKVTAPVVGATKIHHIEGAVQALGVTLTDKEIHYLELAYRPHELSGLMANQ